MVGVSGVQRRWKRVAIDWDADGSGSSEEVQDHHATIKPKNRAYFGPALSAAQI